MGCWQRALGWWEWKKVTAHAGALLGSPGRWFLSPALVYSWFWLRVLTRMQGLRALMDTQTCPRLLSGQAASGTPGLPPSSKDSGGLC